MSQTVNGGFIHYLMAALILALRGAALLPRPAPERSGHHPHRDQSMKACSDAGGVV